ncbi:hypothetical protein M3212_08285 [Alkalihalobacillus oceani]|uniref:hypothetical protein n=1 Tax=Halalkalibacter oceani TaxID=1653776 RepID=UPI00203B51EE|nr:hypothetical protein [Halalkalibacter oceani]MCM3760785.1 hypothetical protein [Halalkalibacter oceani]
MNRIEVDRRTAVIASLTVKSKKKRIRQKALKKALQESGVQHRRESVSVSDLPVTVLLQIGKSFFKEEQVVKHYYQAGKPEFYKNKSLLCEVLETKVEQLPEAQWFAFKEEISRQKAKRSR